MAFDLLVGLGESDIVTAGDDLEFGIVRHDGRQVVSLRIPDQLIKDGEFPKSSVS